MEREAKRELGGGRDGLLLNGSGRGKKLTRGGRGYRGDRRTLPQETKDRPAKIKGDAKGGNKKPSSTTRSSWKQGKVYRGRLSSYTVESALQEKKPLSTFRGDRKALKARNYLSWRDQLAGEEQGKEQ